MTLSLEVLTRAGKKGGRSHKHKWTDEERDVIRCLYRSTKNNALELAARLSGMTGDRITACAVKGQASKMGIMRTGYKDWTHREIERLANLITRYPVHEVAKMMNRSVNAVRVKATRLNYSTRVHDDWFTMREVAEIFGVDAHKVKRWIDAGELKANPHNNLHPQQKGMAMWRIKSTDLKVFIQTHSLELTGRNVDLFTIVNILAPRNSQQVM